MKTNMKLLCLLSALSISAAVVQATTVQVFSAETNTPAVVSTAPVAFVYVSNTPGTGANKINAFAAAANGKLTPVPGSPFPDNVTFMAVNGKYLFGSNKGGVFVAAFQYTFRLISSSNRSRSTIKQRMRLLPKGRSACNSV